MIQCKIAFLSVINIVVNQERMKKMLFEKKLLCEGENTTGG